MARRSLQKPDPGQILRDLLMALRDPLYRGNQRCGVGDRRKAAAPGRFREILERLHKLPPALRRWRVAVICMPFPAIWGLMLPLHRSGQSVAISIYIQVKPLLGDARWFARTYRRRSPGRGDSCKETVAPLYLETLLQGTTKAHGLPCCCPTAVPTKPWETPATDLRCPTGRTA